MGTGVPSTGSTAVVNSIWSPWISALVLGLLAILITLLFWMVLPEGLRANESVDYTGFYRPVALNLLAGEGHTLDGRPATRYPPGFPLLLSGAFGLAGALGIPEGTMVSLLLLGCMSAGTVLLFGIAYLVWGQPLAWIPPGLWMTYPFALWLTKQPNSEMPFIVFLFAAFFLFFNSTLPGGKPRSRTAQLLACFVVGLLIGFAMLIRPIAVGIGIILSVTLFFLRSEASIRLRLSLAALLLFGNLVVVLPWQRYLSSHTNRTALLSTATAPALRDGLTFAVNLKGFRQGIEVPDDVRVLMTDLHARYDELDSLGAIVSIIVHEFTQRPTAVAKLFLLKAARSWYGTDSQRFESPTRLIQIVYLAIIVGGILLSWRRNQRSRWLLKFILPTALYFWGMTILSSTLLRYMVPAIGLLFLTTPAYFCKPGRTGGTE